MATSCARRTSEDAVVYGVASFGKAVTKGISKAYSKPRDNRELAIGVAADLFGLFFEVTKSYVNSGLCDPFPDYNEPKESIASRYKQIGTRYSAIESA